MKNVFEKVVCALSLFDRYKRGCAAFKCHFCGYSEMGYSHSLPACLAIMRERTEVALVDVPQTKIKIKNSLAYRPGRAFLVLKGPFMIRN